MAYEMPGPCKFPSFDSCQKRFLLTTKNLILLRTQSLALCSKWEIRRSFLMHLVSKSLDPFFRVGKQGPCFTAIEKNGGDKRLVELELARNVLSLYPHCTPIRALPRTAGTTDAETKARCAENSDLSKILSFKAFSRS